MRRRRPRAEDVPGPADAGVRRRRRGDARPRRAARRQPARRVLRPAAGRRPAAARAGRRAVRDRRRGEVRARSAPGTRSSPRRRARPDRRVVELSKDSQQRIIADQLAQADVQYGCTIVDGAVRAGRGVFSAIDEARAPAGPAAGAVLRATPSSSRTAPAPMPYAVEVTLASTRSPTEPRRSRTSPGCSRSSASSRSRSRSSSRRCSPGGSRRRSAA